MSVSPVASESADADVKRRILKQLPEDTSKWPMDAQMSVLSGVLLHKPVGVNAAFRMAALIQSICDSSGMDAFGVPRNSFLSEYDITSNDVRKFLQTMYDVDGLEQHELSHPLLTESKPTSKNSESKFSEFALPEDEYSDMMMSKIDVVPETPSTTPTKSEETSSSTVESKPLRGKRSTKNLSRRSGATNFDETESANSSRSSTPAGLSRRSRH